MGGKLINLKGKRFGKLEVKERAGSDKWGTATWLCQCDCGGTKVVRGGSLRSGKVKSCGCLYKLPEGVAMMRFVLRGYREKAKRRRLVFNLTEEEFMKLTSQFCYYCGVKPKQTLSNKAYNGNFIYNGLDRVDNDKGYTLENVVPCCGICNRAKKNLTQEEFYKWIERVYLYGKEQNVLE